MSDPLITALKTGAADVLKFLTSAEKTVTKAGPQAVAGLALLLGAVSTAMGNATAAASADGLNIALDSATVKSLEAVWPDVKALAADLGITL